MTSLFPFLAGLLLQNEILITGRWHAHEKNGGWQGSSSRSDARSVRIWVVLGAVSQRGAEAQVGEVGKSLTEILDYEKPYEASEIH